MQKKKTMRTKKQAPEPQKPIEKKKAIFVLCDREETPEVIVLSDMSLSEITEAWEDYYWSPNYDNYQGFILKMQNKGHYVYQMESAKVIVP